MNKLWCFGEALIDLHGQKADGVGPPTFIAHAGGAPANVSVAAARLGTPAGFIGMLGADPFGDLLHARLDAAGVDTAHVRRTDAAKTALAFVTLDGNGERSFSFYRPPAADLLFRDGDFDDACFSADSIFHCGSCSLTEAAIAEATLSGMRRARAAGALVSFDMNLRPALWPREADPAPRLWAALACADLIKLSAEEMAFLSASAGSEAAAIERMWQGAARVLLMTDGSAPIRWFTRAGIGSVAAYRVHAIDSTGAGDAFVGGVLHGLAKTGISTGTNAAALDALFADADGRDTLLRFAAACGALAVTCTGSFAAMPERADVLRFLETYR